MKRDVLFMISSKWLNTCQEYTFWFLAQLTATYTLASIRPIHSYHPLGLGMYTSVLKGSAGKINRLWVFSKQTSYPYIKVRYNGVTWTSLFVLSDMVCRF